MKNFELPYKYLVVGGSGSGKDTIVNNLCIKYGFNKVASYTTRPKRANEYKQKIPSHTFVSKEMFDNICKTKNVIAYTEYSGHEYCATMEQLKFADFYIVDKNGLDMFARKQVIDNYKVVCIYVPRDVREKRMMGRGDSYSEIQSRLDYEDNILKQVEVMADYIVVNDGNIENAISQFEKILADNLK